jgi:hypothetical protein
MGVVSNLHITPISPKEYPAGTFLFDLCITSVQRRAINTLKILNSNSEPIRAIADSRKRTDIFFFFFFFGFGFGFWFCLLLQEKELDPRIAASDLLSVHCTTRKLTIKFIWASTCTDVAPPPKQQRWLASACGLRAFLSRDWLRPPSVGASVTAPPLRRVAGACAARLTSLLLSRRRPGRPARAAGTMFRRKLTALDYHNPSGFNCKGGWRPRGSATAPPQPARTRTQTRQPLPWGARQASRPPGGSAGTCGVGEGTGDALRGAQKVRGRLPGKWNRSEKKIFQSCGPVGNWEWGGDQGLIPLCRTHR